MSPHGPAASPLPAADSSLLDRRERLLAHEKPIAAHLPFAFEERPWRRPAGHGAVAVEDAAVARAEEKLRSGLPVHRTSQVGAVHVEDLEHLRSALLTAAHPERGVRGLTRPRERARVADRHELRLADREIHDRTNRDELVGRRAKKWREEIPEDGETDDPADEGGERKRDAREEPSACDLVHGAASSTASRTDPIKDATSIS